MPSAIAARSAIPSWTPAPSVPAKAVAPVKTQVKATSGGEVGVAQTTDLGGQKVEISASNLKAGVNVQGKSGEFWGVNTSEGPYGGYSRSLGITPSLRLDGVVQANLGGLSAATTLKQEVKIGSVKVSPFVEGTVKLGGSGSAAVGAEIKVDRFNGTLRQTFNGGFSAEVAIDVS